MIDKLLASQVLRSLHEISKMTQPDAPSNAKCVVTINPTPAGVEPFMLFLGDYEAEDFDGEQTPTAILQNTFEAKAGTYTVALISSATYVDFMQAFTITAGDVATETKTIDITLVSK